MRVKLRTLIYEAERFDGTLESAEQIISWSRGAILCDMAPTPDEKLTLKMKSEAGETLTAHRGDYIIQVGVSRFEPVKPTLFNVKYEPT